MTLLRVLILCLIMISTHTPVRVWLFWHRHLVSVIWFQLTHPWGCDITCSFPKLSILLISTHTPVRVWQNVNDNGTENYDFNSHTREGVTHQNQPSYLHAGFQLTHPWGCDPAWMLCYHIWYKFQLTHPWGCDLLIAHDIKSMEFQLTHPWGCD